MARRQGVRWVCLCRPGARPDRYLWRVHGVKLVVNGRSCCEALMLQWAVC